MWLLVKARPTSADAYVRMPSMSFSCFSCVRPSLKLYLYAYTSLCPRLASNSRLTWERSSPAAQGLPSAGAVIAGKKQDEHGMHGSPNLDVSYLVLHQEPL